MKRPAPPRIALTLDEAAASIGVSRDSFDRHIRPELRLIRKSGLILVPVHELQRWADREAALTIEARP